MDIENYDNVNALVTSSLQQHSVKNTVNAFKNRALDTSFSTCYYPDVMYDAGDGEGEKQLPASVGALGAYSLNDRIGFAPIFPHSRGGVLLLYYLSNPSSNDRKSLPCRDHWKVSLELYY